jgi:hypothetical protein
VTALLPRMLGASLLRADTFEEVEADPRSLRQAAAVVLAAAAAIALSRWIQGTQAGLAGERLVLQTGLSFVEPFVLWIFGSAFAYMVGASFFRGPETQTDFAELLRTTGFAFSPALLRGFACLPPALLGLGIDIGARLWVFAAVVIALRQALDFTTARAVATFGMAAVLLWLVLWGLSTAPLPGL